jgi:hypothetical protein
MTSILGDITNECITMVYTLIKKNKNKKKIKFILDTMINLLFDDLKPFLYTIMGILILIFIMNCTQFFYYISLFKKGFPKTG